MAKPKVLDTNILVLAIRNASLWQKIKEKYKIEFQNTYISIVTEAEILSLAEQFEWGETKRKQLTNLLANLTIIPIDAESLVNAYINLDLYSQKKLKGIEYPDDFTPRNMGKNDVWIAATAYATNSMLISTDKDFEHLQSIFIDFVWVDITKENS